MGNEQITQKAHMFSVYIAQEDLWSFLLDVAKVSSPFGGGYEKYHLTTYSLYFTKVNSIYIMAIIMILLKKST